MQFSSPRVVSSVYVYRTKDGHNILFGVSKVHKHNYNAQCIFNTLHIVIVIGKHY